jgi:DNA-directed RNA polymerase specialized sigma24 family protein
MPKNLKTNTENAYQAHLERNTWVSFEDMIKAEPDRAIAEDNTPSEQLEAALFVINNGGLQKLSAMQQKIYQLYVVEGHSYREVSRQLGLSDKGVAYNVEMIGLILRVECEKHLKVIRVTNL